MKETKHTKRKRKKMTKSLKASLKAAVVEKDVETAFKAAFEKLYPGCIASPEGTDGLLEHEEISVAMEYKYDWDLRSSLDQANVLIQSIFYLKKMTDRGNPLPKVVFVGDINECFCVPSSDLTKYFSENVDWSLAPSAACKKNPDMVVKIADDEDIRPFVYNVGENFDFQMVVEKMKKISQGKPYAIPITKKNIVEIFRRFENDVVTDKTYTTAMVWDDLEEKRMSQLVDLFFACLTCPDDVYLHPKRRNEVVVRDKRVRVNSANYRAFFSEFRQEYTPIELDQLTANKDRILEDVHRRRTGAFFTPDLWVDEAHKMIADSLGEDWKDEYVVWDCCCGTANLTRNYKFKELYISTIEQSDINTINDCKYNPEATIFRYDFLSSMGLENLPEKLKEAFRSGKKILFLINPPYGKSAGIGMVEKDVSKTFISGKMKNNKMGKCSEQLYAQFLYKISSFASSYNNVCLSIFAPPLFMIGNSFTKIREHLYANFNFRSGMLLEACHFADVSKAMKWGISFTVWSSGNTQNDKLTFTVKQVGSEFTIEGVGEKTVFPPKTSAQKWCKKDKPTDRIPHVTLKSAINLATKKLTCDYDKMSKHAVGFFHNNCNSVYYNTSFVGIYSAPRDTSNGFPFTSANFRKVVALFTARKSIKPNWINCKDEYLIPDFNHPDYEQWNNDCIVYSLFNNSSQQSSLRQIDYKNKKWDIINHFFFMSNEEMRKLANDAKFNAMYQDSKQFDKDRYVYNLLEDTVLSSDAEKVLEAARELMKKSMVMRKAFHDENPHYHLNSWDSGWSQLKPLFKKYYKDDYDAFVKMYKDFENEMRKGVYKFGFLLK